MSAVWLLSTRGRPEACQRTLDACEKTGMRSQGLVYVDGSFEEYKDLRLPSNWHIRRAREWKSLAHQMRYTLKRYPDATQYGWLADDNIPRTHGWDQQLEEAAGDWHIAFARDFWMSEVGWLHATGGPCFTSGLCWGAKLIEAAGWWALPGVKQGGIDGAWNDIAGILKIHRYLPHVEIEHLTWKLKKRDKDETDSWVKNGETYVATDLAFYETWAKTDRVNVINRIEAAMRQVQAQ